MGPARLLASTWRTGAGLQKQRPRAARERAERWLPADAADTTEGQPPFQRTLKEGGLQGWFQATRTSATEVKYKQIFVKP